MGGRHRLREEIASLPRHSKQWWVLNRDLLQKQAAACSGIPPLKESGGTWTTKSKAKTDIFAKTEKCKPLSLNRLKDVADEPGELMSGFLPLRRRTAKRLLSKLDAKIATGPDKLSARIFKECAEELALPIVLVARRLLSLAEWPESWRFHWGTPLFKKGARSDAGKCRGVHLTTAFSQVVVERLIGSVLTPFLRKVGAFGSNQWADQTGRSGRDVLALLTTDWFFGV